LIIKRKNAMCTSPILSKSEGEGRTINIKEELGRVIRSRPLEILDIQQCEAIA